MLRTHTIGEVDEKLIGQKVTLSAWVDTIREHGKVIFLDLRDRYGKVQTVIISKNECFEEAKRITKESVVQIEGVVNARPKGSENPELKSGKVEVFIETFRVLSKAAAIPFELGEEISDEIRMKYKFLDLRTENMQKNIAFRSKVARAVREHYLDSGFIEIETPLLIKPTPEGARDYIVPSRVNPGKFYALPQSPQLYKQMLMISGFDKYFSLAKCLRDEDLRQDRQPEHTQIDFEMSFVESDDIMSFVEGMLKDVFKKTLGVELAIPFPRITYEDAMKKYGTDKPDLRKDKSDMKEFAFCWTVDFPLFSYDEDSKSWVPEHHMFSCPKPEFFESLEEDPGKVKGDLFDLVLNGVEMASGSIRVSDPDLQERIMKIIGMSKKEAEEKFGFLLEAYKYGGPVHGGMGIGFDRLVSSMLGFSDIREVVAFPKNKSAQNPMDGSPSVIDKKDLDIVHVSVILPKEEKVKSKTKKK